MYTKAYAFLPIETNRILNLPIPFRSTVAFTFQRQVYAHLSLFDIASLRWVKSSAYNTDNNRDIPVLTFIILPTDTKRVTNINAKNHCSYLSFQDYRICFSKSELIKGNWQQQMLAVERALPFWFKTHIIDAKKNCSLT